ncbi:MAG: alanine--tRNA ligase-related protein [Patescibacteria group bacterium]
MNHLEIRQKFVDFFESKGHKVVPSSSLLPVDDPSVLLTTAGMQQFKPYFVGQKDPQSDFASLNTVSIQKCFRTADIDEVGDDTHLTFFEMLGNFSFGGYWKQEAIQYAWEFLTSSAYMGIEPSRIKAHYYNGNRPGTSEDVESKQALESLEGLSEIHATDDSETFWGPTGDEGPCGPTVEFYVDGVEVWNNVFNEFYCAPDKSLSPLKTQGVDTGMGLERLSVAVNKVAGIFDTDLLTATKALVAPLPARSQRVVADHARGTVFLISDHVTPSNKEQGYILRRILRRLLIHIYNSGVGLEELLGSVIDQFAAVYPELKTDRDRILEVARTEADKFSRTLDSGTKELDKIISQGTTSLDGEEAFKLFSTYGLPIDYIKERIAVDDDGFNEAFKAHQEMSRAGADQKFGGHGLSAGAQVSDEDRAKITALHTSTHLLHAALHQVLGPEAFQSGSDINPERTRFDFSFNRKLTDEEKQAVEDWVNNKIQTGFVVTKQEMPYQEAIDSGAQAFFKEKYPDIVTVYTMTDSDGNVVSKELCGGPHVESSKQLGHFRIAKEESSSAGIRRIKAVLE